MGRLRRIAVESISNVINDKANLKLLQNQLVNAIEDGDLINLLLVDDKKDIRFGEHKLN